MAVLNGLKSLPLLMTGKWAKGISVVSTKLLGCGNSSSNYLPSWW